ncbi:MAG: ABC transporter permease [Bacteroidales bacterium]|nr:ABC transporter permease [Bacteroidales bacterium]
MVTYYLKSAYRNLLANKRFTIINIAGFSFAISICMAIGLFLAQEYSYDRYNANADKIVRLIDSENNSSLIDYRVKDILHNTFPEIENACLVLRSGHPIEVRSSNKGFYLDDLMSVDNQFFEIFTIKFLTGQTSMPFSDINSAVITKSTSVKLFGSENGVGRELLVWGNVPVTVTGVIEDFPDNSSITAGLLVNAENERFKFYQSIGNSNDLSTYRWLFQVYLQLGKNSKADLLADNINRDIAILHPYSEAVGFLKLKDIYLHDKTSGSETKQGNSSLLNLLAGIALIILLLAVINYINLTVAQQHKRNKDTGIKKTFGASRKDILMYFLTESLLVSVVAFFIGIYLVWIMIPFYNSVFDTTLNISYFSRLPYSILLVGSILIIGVLSGSGPAVMLSGFTPVRVLSGAIVSHGRKQYFRSLLTIFQFTISIILIFCVIVVMRQIKYVKHMSPGFNEELLLRVDLPNIQKQDEQKAMTFLAECRKSPYIKRVSLSGGVPGQIYMYMGTNMQNTAKNISIPSILADTAFLETFGLKVVRGRNLAPGDYGNVCMMNEAAFKHFEFDNLDNKRFNNWRKEGFEIIGILNDFQYTSLHKSIGPVCIIFTPGFRPTAMNIRFARNGAGPGIDAVRKLWDEMLPVYPFKYQFYDEWFDSLYKSEERFARTISLFAILVIVISCIGILGLAIFSSERRTKEIGIRKANGADIIEIMIMLNRSFAVWVAIAFFIGLPVMYFSMKKWLSSFAYRTTLDWWIFLFAGFLAFVIALLTVSWQSWRAATRNPVEALRYE